MSDYKEPTREHHHAMTRTKTGWILFVATCITLGVAALLGIVYAIFETLAAGRI